MKVGNQDNLTMSILARPSSPINSQIEMDITSRQNSLTFESSANYESTKGINIQNVSQLYVLLNRNYI